MRARPLHVMAAILTACLAVQLAWPLASVPLRVSWDYGEGWNAYWAARAMAGTPLYTDRLSAVTNNYPPLSFYITGVAGRLAGDQILAGRIVSLASLAACAAMIAALVARLGGGRRWGAAAAGAFLLYVGGFAWRYVGSDDPQWLAAGFTLAALLVLTRRDRASPGRIVAASALLVVGGLVKHNQLAAPIAVTLWLALADRRGLAIWLLGSALLVGAALLLLHAAFGPPLFDQVLHHRRLLKARYALTALQTLSGLLPEMGLAAALWAARRRHGGDRRILLVLLFAAVALPLGFVERLGTGVSVNAHFDGAIGLMVAAGVALGRVDVLSPRARSRLAAIALVPLVAATIVMLPGTIVHFSTRADARARWDRAIAMIRQAHGPVACELPALCYWAGKPFLVDFYNYGQKLRTIGDPARLDRAIARRGFALMVVVRDRRFLEDDGRLPDAYNRAVAANYRPVLALPDHGFVLAPRSG